MKKKGFYYLLYLRAIQAGAYKKRLQGGVFIHTFNFDKITVLCR